MAFAKRPKLSEYSGVAYRPQFLACSKRRRLDRPINYLYVRVSTLLLITPLSTGALLASGSTAGDSAAEEASKCAEDSQPSAQYTPRGYWPKYVHSIAVRQEVAAGTWHGRNLPLHKGGLYLTLRYQLNEGAGCGEHLHTHGKASHARKGLSRTVRPGTYGAATIYSV